VKIALPLVRAGVFTLALTLAGCVDQPKKLDANTLKVEVQNAEQLSRECAMVLELRTSGKLTSNCGRPAS
jgi:starvation-inducible outer membrane lipoprotein